MIEAKELSEKFSTLSVLVVGDQYLDIDYIGGYSGYSREVEQLPIFRAEKVKYSPGGAGNLAVCFATLGVKTNVAGYWGNQSDPNRNHMELAFDNLDIDYYPMLENGRTPTFEKVYLHNGQHIYRLDLISEYESGVKMAIVFLGNECEKVDFVACADYEEVHEFGVCSPEVIDAVRQNAKVKFATSRKHMMRFEGYDYIIQNISEVKRSAKGYAKKAESKNPDDKHTLAWWRLFELKAKNLVITLGGKGAKQISAKYPDVSVESKELTENIDPCGCGDMFYAIYSSSVMAGFDPTKCLQLANAGARVVARKLFGTGQANVEEIAMECEMLYG